MRGHCTTHSLFTPVNRTWFLQPQPPFPLSRGSPLPCFPDLPVVSVFLQVLFHGLQLCDSPVNTFLSVKLSFIFEVKMPLSRPSGADDWEVGLCRARSCHGVGGEAASWLPALRNQNPQKDLPQGGADLGHVGITPRLRRSCQLPFWTLGAGGSWAPGAGRGRDPAGECPAAGKGPGPVLKGQEQRSGTAQAPPRLQPFPVLFLPPPRVSVPRAAPGSAHTRGRHGPASTGRAPAARGRRGDRLAS